MEENVALDSKKQKKFDKSIKGIKKLLKKNVDEARKPAVLAPKDDENKGDKKKRKRPERGLVYLSHIPHGFYEHQMTQYFKQFGMVTNVRVIRSSRTGRSKGFAFVEFREPAVAEIVAETMNNYLMGKRLIKAAIIPPEKQKRKAFRKHWSTKYHPTAHRRIKERKAHNAILSDAEHLKKARKMLSHLRKTKKKLNDLGINYDFFQPVDIPKELLEDVTVKAETEKSAKGKKESDEKPNKKKKTNAADTKAEVINKKKPEKQSKPADTKSKKELKKTEEGKKLKESDKVKQNEKQKKMQDAGVKLPENFIKIAAESDEESDSSVDFDSDEYEKMLENDSNASSGDESEDEDDENEEDDDDENEEDDESDDEVSEEELPPPIPIKQKGKKPIVALPPPSKKAAKPIGPIGPKQQRGQPPQPKLAKKGPKPANVAQGQKTQVQPQGGKRKILQPEVSPKKPKFEKKDKPRNKQFKKKNKA